MRATTGPKAQGAPIRQAIRVSVLLVAATYFLVGSNRAWGQADWVVDIDPSNPAASLPPELLGHYDLSGELLGYDLIPGLRTAMNEVGFAEWRVGVGRWEASTNLLPALTDTSSCAIPLPEQAAPTGPSDLALIASRDWFTDDGSAVSLADTQDDSRYALDYFRSVLDVASAFGAKPFVSIDSMPFALAANQVPNRTDCAWSFQNAVSNVRPADSTVFASAAAGLVERIIEGRAGEPARAVTHWEVWNEPEFPQFWDPAFETPPGSLNQFFGMAINTLYALDTYRAASTHPNAAELRFGLGSFATFSVAETVIGSFDSAPVPGGFVPMDFISFHGYSDDPLVLVEGIEDISATAAASTNYQDLELALAEWGPNLGTSAGDPVYAASIQPALHIATVLALGASAGLDRAHRAIFWDFYPDSIRLGLLDHNLNPRSAYRAYELLSKVIGDGHAQLIPQGISDGRLDGGAGAVLASHASDETVRVLLVNRNAAARSVEVRIGGQVAKANRIYRYSDPTMPISVESGHVALVSMPPDSLIMLEFRPPAVPASVTSYGPVLLVLSLLGIAGFAAQRPACSPSRP